MLSSAFENNKDIICTFSKFIIIQFFPVVCLILFRGVAEHVSVRGPRQKHQTEGEMQPTQCQPSRDTIPRDYLGTEGGSDPLENATGGSGNDGE